jgi:hypothetical protein
MLIVRGSDTEKRTFPMSDVDNSEQTAPVPAGGS